MITIYDVGYPIIMPYKSETFDLSLSQSVTDMKRHYQAAVPMPIWAKVAAGSNIGDYWHWGLQLASPVVTENEQQITSVEVVNHEGFEIPVP